MKYNKNKGLSRITEDGKFALFNHHLVAAAHIWADSVTKEHKEHRECLERLEAFKKSRHAN